MNTVINTLDCNIPNLDCMDIDELRRFWNLSSTRSKARELFPTKPKHYTITAKDLGHYAANKATAMSCRLAGNIDTALMYERIADDIYRTLPYYARW